MNVISTTAVGYSVANSSTESLLNDCEKRNQPMKLVFKMPLWLNFHEVCILALSRSGIHKSVLEG